MAGTYTGIVQQGTRRAASLGYPTVNILLTDAAISGIFAAWVVVGKKRYAAAAFADQNRKLLEAHLIDADLDLYGEEIVVELQKKIRESKVFTDDDELRGAIASDVAEVRKFFESSV